MIRRAGAWCLAVSLMAGTGGVVWADARLANDGHLHRVEIESGPNSLPTQSTALRHSIQAPDGTLTSSVVPGSEKPFVNASPALRIDPVTDEPVLVWARNAGTGGFDVAISRFTNGAWTAPATVFEEPGDSVTPQLRIDATLVHVAWVEQTSGESEILRLSLDRETFLPAFGPERIDQEDQNLIPPEGGTSGGQGPSWGLSYFAAADAGSTELPDTLYVWGVRDEPVPIGFKASLELPSGVSSVRNLQSGYIWGAFTVRFVAGDRFYYRTLENGVWSPYQVMLLTSGLSADGATQRLVEMLKRQKDQD